MKKEKENPKNKRTNILSELPRYFLLIALIIMGLIFGVIQPRFFSLTNCTDILRTASIYSLLGIGGILVMSTGDFNYALGADAMLAAVVTGMMFPQFVSYPVAVLLGIAVAVLISYLSALIVIYLHVPSFVATLAIHTLICGIMRYLTGGSTLFNQAWGETFAAVGRTNLVGVLPMPFVILLILGIASHVFLEKTRLGRYIYASGANATAARQVGINVEKTRMISYMICAVFCAIGGIVYAGTVNSVPVSSANDLFTPALASVMLGATFLTPGKYNVPGTVLAAIMIVITQNGVVSIGAPFYLKDIVLGIMLVISVGIIAMVRKEGLPKVSFGD